MASDMFKCDDGVIMRRWEARVFRGYCRLTSIPSNFWHWHIRRLYVKVKEFCVKQWHLRYEYYQDNNGKIKVRRNTGWGGTFKRIDGKEVKVGQSRMVLDDYSMMAFPECNYGFFDEDLGANIKSRGHYRELMKEKGLSPLESTTYSGSPEYRRRKLAEERSRRAMPARERAFIEASKRAEVMFGR